MMRPSHPESDAGRLPFGLIALQAENMKKSVSARKKSRRRPKKARAADPVSPVRFSPRVTAQIDKWAEQHEIGSSEAIRRLVVIGLKADKAK
jgi:hypothetical protein